MEYVSGGVTLLSISSTKYKERPLRIRWDDVSCFVVEDLKTKASKEIEDISVPMPSSPRSIQLQELTNQVLILQSQKKKLELEKNKAKTKVAILTAQPSFPNAKIKTLDALPSLFNKVTEALNKFAQVIESASKKARDQGVPSADPTDTQLVEGGRTLHTPPKSSSQPEREHIKKDKGKKAMSSKDAEEKDTESNSNDDTIHLTESMAESSKKKFKKFDFVTEGGEHVRLTKEQIKE
nr:hypothetical protein [Tanacetum cinerariifolium]